ncbi:GNAT family N-acetyltransferase [Saccharomonospora iraqiensis]|uniref:GNAT family N-acetyltransferase n=1 Tax=Saccharomonospora iraqiensis TaxID=52698 RepID=UPI000424BB82|nr:GNAT family N-acetyltransferase [Saccharomonospora iraqiensis]
MFEPHGQPTPVVRGRRADDVSACATALVAVHEADGYPVEGVTDPEAWLTPENLLRAWVAELAGEVVGHVCLTAPTDSDPVAATVRAHTGTEAAGLAVLGRLFVLPEARRHRAGELLTRTATDYAAVAGRRPVLEVMDKDRAAIRLYERLGWRRIATTGHDSGHGRVPAHHYIGPAPSSRWTPARY